MSLASFSSTSTTFDALLVDGATYVTRPITLLSGQNTVRGALLGKITIGAVTSAAKSGGNTGNGTCTVDATTPALAGAKAGVYKVRCTVRTTSAVAAAGTASAATGNTGDGTITASPATGSGCLVGTYRAVCVVAASNSGTFDVIAPSGAQIGKATVGTPFTTHLTFTISDGNADFIVGDAFNIVVTAEYDEVFVVSDPDGLVVGQPIFLSGVSGTATFSDAQIKFALADGATDFAVGDGFDITVAAGSGKYKLSLSASLDGSQTPAAILVEDCDASLGDKSTVAYVTGVFNSNKMTFGTGHTASSVRDALQAKGILLPAVQVVY